MPRCQSPLPLRRSCSVFSQSSCLAPRAQCSSASSPNGVVRPDHPERVVRGLDLPQPVVRRLAEMRFGRAARPSLKLRYVCSACHGSRRVRSRCTADRTAACASGVGAIPTEYVMYGASKAASAPWLCAAPRATAPPSVAHLGREDRRPDRARDERVDRLVVEAGQHAAVTDAGRRLLGIHVQLRELGERHRLHGVQDRAERAERLEPHLTPRPPRPHQIASTSTNDLPRTRLGEERRAVGTA